MARPQRESIGEFNSNMKRSKKNRTEQKRAWRWFFLNGQLHKLLSVSYARDECVAWCYPENKRKLYQWSDIRRRASRGFTVRQVANMMNRNPQQINRYIWSGQIEKPAMAVGPGSNFSIRIFTEEEVFKIRDVVASQSRGRPRNDGLIVPLNVPSREEVYAKMKYNAQLYIKTEDGRFVPLYEAEDW
jgi:hypothetical protein